MVNMEKVTGLATLDFTIKAVSYSPNQAMVQILNTGRVAVLRLVMHSLHIVLLLCISNYIFSQDNSNVLNFSLGDKMPETFGFSTVTVYSISCFIITAILGYIDIKRLNIK